MKSNTKAQNKALSMKDALNEFKSLKVIESRNETKDWRDGLWNYPIFIEKTFRKTIPFSFIVVFGFIAFLFVLFLQSHTFTKFLKANAFSNTQYVEGMMGAKSSFNPLFTSNNYVDKAIDSLIFQKFVYIDKNGKPTPGVAKSWSVSGDSLTYTFVIDEGLHWSDGTELTVGDILFTFNTAMALDPQVSVGAALEGVNITQIDSRTIQFVLTEANPTFFEAVSIYIVSQEELGGVALNDFSNERYASLMGSGKYFIQKNESNAVYLSDNIYDNYNPHIKKLVFRIYPDFDSLEMAMRVGDIDALGSWNNEALAFMQEYITFGVLTKSEEYRNRILFLNTRKDVFKDKNIRVAFNYLFNVDSLLQDAHIQGEAMQGPYPNDSWVFNNQISYYPYDATKATELLTTAGYTKNAETGYFESKEGKILSFTLSYLENDVNNRLVDAIIKAMDKEGIVIKPNNQSFNEISQQTIVTRDFEILLYEIETLVDPDQYNLWHSSKVNDPFLNLSGYQYERVDILLEDARKTTNEATRKTKYFQFQKYIMADAPVVFLYHPSYLFYFDSKLTGIDMTNINFSYDRYWNIEDWAWSY